MRGQRNANSHILHIPRRQLPAGPETGDAAYTPTDPSGLWRLLEENEWSKPAPEEKHKRVNMKHYILTERVQVKKKRDNLN